MTDSQAPRAVIPICLVVVARASRRRRTRRPARSRSRCETSLAMSENVAVPLSAATTRYGVVVVVADHARRAGRPRRSTMLSVTSSSPTGTSCSRRCLRPAGLAAAVGRRPLEHEAAFGADRDDQRVLDHLRLHQAEHLGAEVLAPVGPAEAAAGDLAAAQVHSLDPRRVDEDLEQRPRQRQDRDLRRVELDRQVGVGLPSAVVLEGVGADDRADHRQEAAQDAVLVEAGDGVERLFDLGRDPLGGVAVVARRGRGGPGTARPGAARCRGCAITVRSM